MNTIPHDDVVIDESGKVVALSPRSGLRAVPNIDGHDFQNDADAAPPSGNVVLSGGNEPLPDLGSILLSAHARAVRRAEGAEKPIPLPWLSLLDHFGGGLWPGVHYVSANTGIGKTQLALQAALHAATRGFPVAYVGLELEPDQIGVRLMGERARVPWSTLYTGKAGPEWLGKAADVIPALSALPFHPVFGRPQGWPASELQRLGATMREKYPETDGPGSRPIMVVLDFLQILGAEPDGGAADIRERISRAAYQCRALAMQGFVVLVISSVSRQAVTVLANAQTQARLTFNTDPSGRPTKRRIGLPDAIVGLGKESGEIEFSGDSVSVLFRVAGTFEEGQGSDVVFATAKGRATAPTWSPLRFTGFGYEECPDGGARVVEAWQKAGEKRQAIKAEKVAAKDAALADRVVRDAAAVAAYVTAHPNCSVRECRKDAVGDVSARWKKAVETIGGALAQGPDGLTIDVSALPAEVTECL